MFANTYQKGFLSVFYSLGSSPLQIWDRQVSAIFHNIMFSLGSAKSIIILKIEIDFMSMIETVPFTNSITIL